MNKHSNCKTEIVYKGNKVFKKYTTNTINKSYYEELNNMILNYQKKLESSYIPVPKMFSNNKLEFEFLYCGSSVIDELKIDPINYFKNNPSIFKDILLICKQAIDNKIYFDPHIKNFTILNSKIYYVDIFPPYSDEYEKLLILNNPGKENEIKKHFNLFKPNIIGSHFIADFKKSFLDENKLLSYIIDLALELDIISVYNENLINQIIKQEATFFKKDTHYFIS